MCFWSHPHPKDRVGRLQFFTEIAFAISSNVGFLPVEHYYNICFVLLKSKIYSGLFWPCFRIHCIYQTRSTDICIVYKMLVLKMAFCAVLAKIRTVISCLNVEKVVFTVCLHILVNKKCSCRLFIHQNF